MCVCVCVRARVCACVCVCAFRTSLAQCFTSTHMHAHSMWSVVSLWFYYFSQLLDIQFESSLFITAASVAQSVGQLP